MIEARRRALMTSVGNNQWQTLDVQTRKPFRQIVNSARIVPPQNGVVYLRLDSNREHTNGVVLLGYIITFFNGVVYGTNSYRYLTASEDNPVVPNEHSYFDGTYIGGGNWTINDGVLYRNGDDNQVETDEKIKVLVVEVPSADSFLPGVTA